MPRFYFDVFNGDHVDDRDDVGHELPDREAAWELATRYAGESLLDLDGDLRPDTAWRLEVRAENGTCIFRIAIHASQY